MNVLVIGSGGREHSLIYKLKQELEVQSIFALPGNAGIANDANIISLNPLKYSEIVDFVNENKISLTIVGPEIPLSKGIVDYFTSKGLTIFGPAEKASQLEASKVFSKDFFKKYKIPTANYEVFESITCARDYIKTVSFPIVIKVDGLAAGKGVFICHDLKESEIALHSVFQKKIFGDAGHHVVIEDFLEGEEISFMVMTDGETVLPLESAKDYKKIFENDKGPNTGGMGSISPSPLMTTLLTERVMNQVIYPTLQGLASENIHYQGILYAGLMIRNEDINLLEYNVRFGDPETQSLMLRLKSNLSDCMTKCCNQQLHTVRLDWDKHPSACVTMVAEGYPGDVRKGDFIKGLDSIVNNDVRIFHAGTAMKNNNYVTNGGRVLNVCSKAETLKQALSSIYEVIPKIQWEGVCYRQDIGRRES